MEIICKGKNCGEKYVEVNLNKPVSICGKCGYPNAIPKENIISPPPTGNPKPTSSKEAGWLIVHDENAPSQTHSLSVGRQVIGRKNTNKPCTIMIDTEDDFMSRNHAIIDVNIDLSGNYKYVLTDNSSMNGTRINADKAPLSPNDAVLLIDGYVIQMGMTKVVFKSFQMANNAQEATQIVRNQDYAPTVIIKRQK
jgi:FHA domain